jgi:peptidoglycan/xylan/chitin deacetylase (PgdA/CDA1 family)
MRILAREADVIGVDDIDGVLRQRGGRHVLITFDDGYRDSYEAAFPILREHGLPATFFPITSCMDRPQVMWWDELAWIVATSSSDVHLPRWGVGPLPVRAGERDGAAALAALISRFEDLDERETHAFLDDVGEAAGTGRCPAEPAADLWLTWDMAREMEAGGMSFGGHTSTHPILERCSGARQVDEVRTCLTRLRAELRHPITAFSYPVGRRGMFSATDLAPVFADLGIRFAFSAYGGLASRRDWDPFDIRRTSPGAAFDGSALRASLVLPKVFARW